MKYLQAINWAFLALGAAMFISMGVVCLMYMANLDTSPRIRHEFQAVLLTTLLFLAVAVSAAAAAFGHRRHRIWRWPAELTLVFSVVALLWYYAPR